MKIKHKILIYNVAALSSSLFAPLLINNTMAISQTKTTTTNASVRVSNFCSMTANIQPGEEHSTTLIGGQYQADIGKTTIQTFCNDPNGYAIYAIGYTGGDTGVTAGTNTVLHSTALGSTYDIVTGIAQSGDTSNWAMKLTSVDGTYKPTILNNYDSYSLVPINYTKVADFNSNTDAIIGSSLTTTYATYINPTQPAGTYEGQVKYVLLHPASNLGPGTYYMQDVEDWGNTVAIGEEVIAYDFRDNKPYTVRRMCMSGTSGDSGCNLANSMLWMTQNLDLDLDNTIALTSENTDLRDGSLSGAYSSGYSKDVRGVIYWTPATTTIVSIDSSQGKFNGWTNNGKVAYSADPDAGNLNNLWYANGEVYNSVLCEGSQACNYLDDNNMIAPTYFRHTPFVSNGSHGKIGNYYNWSAAIASNNSSSLSMSTYSNVVNNPQNSICPKGWRLPTISSIAISNEFARLYNSYSNGGSSGGSSLIDSPIYMVRSGNIYGGSVNSAGYSGVYWSSTVDGSDYAYYMNFRSGYVNPASTGGYYRSSGRSIRCVSDY